MGQRVVPRVEPAVPAVMKRLQQLPLITPIALALAAVIGDDAVALSPIPNQVVHAALAILVGTALGGAVYGASFFLQRRYMTEVQGMVPKEFRLSLPTRWAWSAPRPRAARAPS